MAYGVVLDLAMAVDVLLGFGGMGVVIHIGVILLPFLFHPIFVYCRLGIYLLLLLQRIWNSIFANLRGAF